MTRQRQRDDEIAYETPVREGRRPDHRLADDSIAITAWTGLALTRRADGGPTMLRV